MPVASGINGTIQESRQTQNQRAAFNRNNPDGQKESIRNIFSSSPVHSASLTLTNDRSSLYEEGDDPIDQSKKAYAKLLESNIQGGFGFKSTDNFNLSFNDNKSTDNLSLTFHGIASPDDTDDKPQLGSANLFTHGDLNDPSAENSEAVSGSRNENFGTSIPNPNTDTLGQFFKNRVDGE